jgi:hypothetical protein
MVEGREGHLWTGTETREEEAVSTAGTVASLDTSLEIAQSLEERSKAIGETITKDRPRDRGSMMMLREDPSDKIWLIQGIQGLLPGTWKLHAIFNPCSLAAGTLRMLPLA